MPLVDLRTNLKSLKYGHDRPGGGSSDQPYIQTDVNDPTSTIRNLVARGSVIKIGAKELKEIRLFNSELSKTIGTLIDTAVNFDDGFIRGGAIRAANDSITDLFRVGKFLTDLPRGPLFIAKQVGLQLSNPRVEVSTLPTNKPTNGPVGINNIINFVSNVANKIENTFGPTRLYNLGINTIAQVPLTAFGGHIARHGFLPNNDDSKYYENVITTKNFQNKSSRLLDLTTNFNLGPAGINKGEVTKTGITGAFAQLGTNFLSGNLGSVLASSGVLAAASGLFAQQNTIDDYLGGPNSVYGIGRTTIMRKADTENKEKIDFSLKQSSIFAGKSSDTKNYPLEFGLDRLLGASNHTPSTLQNVVSSSSGPISNDDNYIPVNLNNRISTDNIASDKSGSYHVPTSFDPSNDIGMGSNAISNYPDIPTGSNEIEGGVYNTAVSYANNRPGFRKYAELAKAVNNITRFDYYHRNPTSPLSSGSNVVGPAPLYGVLDSINLHQNNVNFHDYDPNKNNINKFDLSQVKYTNIEYKNVYGQKVSIIPSGKTWDSVAREQRIGDFGKQDIRVKVKRNGKLEKDKRPVQRADSINLTPLFTEDRYYSGDSKEIDGIKYNTRDLAKFVIQTVAADSPGKGIHMIFRALITGLSDSVDAKWNDINYVGRGTPLYIYTGTTRKVSLKFKVAALSFEEMGPMYTKLNYLMSSLMPNYSSIRNGVMRGDLHRLTVGNYFDAQLGIITSLSYSVPDDAPWEIAIDEPEGGIKTLILPHIIEVSIDFTPIGVETKGANRLERKGLNLSYIAQNNTGEDVNNIQYTYADFGYVIEDDTNDDIKNQAKIEQEAELAQEQSAQADQKAQEAAQAASTQYSIGPGLVQGNNYTPYTSVYGPNGEIIDIVNSSGNNIFVGNTFGQRQTPVQVPYKL
jgi:hypothetical protein